jgi:hypothetical protein
MDPKSANEIKQTLSKRQEKGNDLPCSGHRIHMDERGELTIGDQITKKICADRDTEQRFFVTGLNE